MAVDARNGFLGILMLDTRFSWPVVDIVTLLQRAWNGLAAAR